MRAPPYRWLAVLALALTRAFAAGAEPAPGLVTDSSGQPVRGSSGACWRASAGTSGMASACPGGSSSGAGAVAATAHGHSTASAVAAQPPSRASFAPISARGNPGYLTDTNGIVVRSSRGDCWHTGSWTPELATVVGCDGVLAKAVPVPAPAPSPKPEPPAESGTQPPARPAGTQTEPPPPPPPAVEPSQAVPAPAPAPTTPPPAAKPRSGRKPAPAIVPPAAPTPAPSALAPPGEPAVPSEKRPEPASEKVTLDTDTYFDFDKATLKPEGRRKLDALAERISGMQLEVVVATGHTDSTGTKAYNQRLSERRAQAVKHYLAGKGVPRQSIFTDGKGELQPAISNATRAGRAQNRRVEVEMVGTRSR